MYQTFFYIYRALLSNWTTHKKWMCMKKRRFFVTTMVFPIYFCYYLLILIHLSSDGIVIPSLPEIVKKENCLKQLSSKVISTFKVVYTALHSKTISSHPKPLITYCAISVYGVLLYFHRLIFVGNFLNGLYVIHVFTVSWCNKRLEAVAEPQYWVTE